MRLFFLLIAFISACASTAGREPAQTETRLSDVYPQKLTWTEAVKFCKERNGHLPTAREYVELLKGHGIKVLEADEATEPTPKDFYLVDSVNEDGTLDKFYMNHKGYKRPSGPARFHLLWTASTPPDHPQYAHVFYDEWGGGGGDPKDHLKTAKNSFQCMLPR